MPLLRRQPKLLLPVVLTPAVFGLIWTNTLQELVPAALRGRVASIDFLGSFLLMPVGYSVAGWAADQIGPPLVFVIGGGLAAIVNGLALLHPGIGKLD